MSMAGRCAGMVGMVLQEGWEVERGAVMLVGYDCEIKRV
jgi:hypothetical protein